MKLRKCKQCGERSPVSEGVVTPLSFYCGYDCATAHGKALVQKATKRQIAKQAKEARQAYKARKEAVKRKAEWLADLQAVFNKYVRLRDAFDGCISCDKPASWRGQWHASHFYTRSHSSFLRYNLCNVHKSCSVCNSHLSGNIGQYTPRLIDKIGQERFDWLTIHKTDSRRYEVEWIKRAIKIARQGIKRMERRNSAQSF